MRNNDMVMGWVLVLACSAGAATVERSLVFTGAADGSAAVALQEDRFLAASDEDNILRAYQVSKPGAPVATCDLNRLLMGRRKAPELDLEGGAAVGAHLFWMGSHGRKTDGQPAPHRRALFALSRCGDGENLGLQLFGRVYTNLVDDVARDPRFRAFRLAEAAVLPPESPNGLNIEALAATVRGGLLVGFRNPVPGGRALLVPLHNPVELVSGRPPILGDPVLLDLGGLGLRDLVWTGQGYYLLAGPPKGQTGTGLFFWRGDSTAPRPVPGLQRLGFNPEGLVWLDRQGRGGLLVLSDDSGRQPGRTGARTDRAAAQFRACLVLP